MITANYLLQKDCGKELQKVDVEESNLASTPLLAEFSETLARAPVAGNKLNTWERIPRKEKEEHSSLPSSQACLQFLQNMEVQRPHLAFAASLIALVHSGERQAIG
ncbi:hypothetical protein F0562_006996 [Nyssa sinensis]|uniref:Uncharacterized protein n=1 Tax=Nyssa sinensis TaxID=561372 RepID=A0A5J5A3X6_9ASTE|nr:hypothetical protein F0562_006996 [Nyssa sinensis]